MGCMSSVCFVTLHNRKCFYFILVLYWLFSRVQSNFCQTLLLPPCLFRVYCCWWKVWYWFDFHPWPVVSFSSSLGKFLDFSMSSLEFWHCTSIWIQGWVCFFFFPSLLFIHLLNSPKIVLIWRLLTYFNSKQFCKVWLLFSIYK